MKRRVVVGAAVVALGAIMWGVGRAEDTEAPNQIEKAVRDYFVAAASRDAVQMRRVLDEHFVAIEAREPNAVVNFVNATSDKDIEELLPKNDDFKAIVLSNFKTETTAPESSVGSASFTMSIPLPDAKLERMKAGLLNMTPPLDDAQYKALEKIIAYRALSWSMFAMLAKKGGDWRIICMSFPR